MHQDKANVFFCIDRALIDFYTACGTPVRLFVACDCPNVPLLSNSRNLSQFQWSPQMNGGWIISILKSLTELNRLKHSIDAVSKITTKKAHLSFKWEACKIKDFRDRQVQRRVQSYCVTERDTLHRYDDVAACCNCFDHIILLNADHMLETVVRWSLRTT